MRLPVYAPQPSSLRPGPVLQVHVLTRRLVPSERAGLPSYYVSWSGIYRPELPAKRGTPLPILCAQGFLPTSAAAIRRSL